ncbi:MAG: hypothetical protein EHM35_01365 [Planctomycetaceae bacterium]|nr:MAG: hypothetical protein EHM35_01365 [Planctomycetaceae bacterium]
MRDGLWAVPRPVGRRDHSMVRVHVLPPLPQMLGLGETSSVFDIEVDVEPNASLYDLFCHLAVEHAAFEAWVNPKPEDMRQSILISVDGRLVFRADYGNTLLRDGADVRIFPPYSGG